MHPFFVFQGIFWTAHEGGRNSTEPTTGCVSRICVILCSFGDVELHCPSFVLGQTEFLSVIRICLSADLSEYSATTTDAWLTWLLFAVYVRAITTITLLVYTCYWWWVGVHTVWLPRQSSPPHILYSLRYQLSSDHQNTEHCQCHIP